MRTRKARATAAASSLPNATVHSLPTELLCEIFSYLRVKNYQYPLWSCALVCRLWREAAQRALFAHVDLSSAASQRSWLDSPARARYPTLHVQFGARTWVTLGLEILKACDGLRTLVVRSRERALGGYIYFQTEQAKDIHSAVIRWPHFFPDTAEPIPCRLRKLTLHLEETASERTFKSILLNSRETLHSLTINSTAALPDAFYLHLGVSLLTELIAFFSVTPFPNLHTIEIIDSDPLRWCKILPLLPSLQQLHMYHSTAQRILECLSAVDKSSGLDIKVLIIGQRTSKLESYDLKRIFKIVRLPLLSGLRHLVLPWIAKAELEGPTGLALLGECEKRSIVFKGRYGYLTREMMDGKGGT